MKNQTTLILSILLIFALGFIFWQNFFGAEKIRRAELGIGENNPAESLESEDLNSEIENPPQAEPLNAQSGQGLIVGSWQSLDDPQSVLHFQSNGEMQDIYSGGAVNELGTYQVFDSGNSLPTEITELGENIDSAGVYLRQSFGPEDYYYLIDALDLNSLSLFYLPRGNILEYRRIDG